MYCAVTVLVSPGASTPSVHTIAAAPAPATHPIPDTVPFATAPGQLCVSTTPCASDGPLFVTTVTYWYVCPSPAPTSVCPSLTVAATSARATIVFVSLASSFPGTKSPASPMCALIVTVLPSTPLAGTVYDTFTVVDAPTASPLKSQLSVPPTIAAHDPVAGSTAPTVNTPAGQLTVSGVDCAAAGPKLLTTITYVYTVASPATTVVTPSSTTTVKSVGATGTNNAFVSCATLSA